MKNKENIKRSKNEPAMQTLLAKIQKMRSETLIGTVNMY